MCHECKEAINFIKPYIINGSSSDLIFDFLNQGFCEDLDQPQRALCKTSVNDNIDLIMLSVQSDFDTETICQQGSLCLPSESFQMKMRDFRSSHNKVNLSSSNGQFCENCIYVIEAVQAALPATQDTEQIGNIVKIACSFLKPPSAINIPNSTLCYLTGEKFLRRIIKKVARNIDKRDICKSLKMCSNNFTFTSVSKINY